MIIKLYLHGYIMQLKWQMHDHYIVMIDIIIIIIQWQLYYYEVMHGINNNRILYLFI